MYKNIILLICVSLVIYSCVDYEEVESVEEQREDIIEYLEDNDYSYTSEGGLFKVVSRPKDSSGITLATGDSLYIYFVQYLFDSGIGDAYYTNIYSVAAEYDLLDTDMDFSALGIKYGTTSLIEGYEIGFRDAMQGDTLTLFMTSAMAYGSQQTSVVPKNQSIASVVIIEKIVK